MAFAGVVGATGDAAAVPVTATIEKVLDAPEYAASITFATIMSMRASVAWEAAITTLTTEVRFSPVYVP